LAWFAQEPEWYDMNNNNFAQSEAQSLSVFAQYLLAERVDDSSLFDSKGRLPENGNCLNDAVR
jgi:phosphatidylinositol 4-kinase A